MWPYRPLLQAPIVLIAHLTGQRQVEKMTGFIRNHTGEVMPSGGYSTLTQTMTQNYPCSFLTRRTLSSITVQFEAIGGKGLGTSEGAPS